jgi:hypothetical protein
MERILCLSQFAEQKQIRRIFAYQMKASDMVNLHAPASVFNSGTPLQWLLHKGKE